MSEVQTINAFDAWLAELAAYFVSHSQMTPEEAHSYVYDNRPDWKVYCDDEYTAADAADEDMSYWETDHPRARASRSGDRRMSEREFPHEFLGRCQTCLGNAYLSAKPCRIGFGNGMPLNDDDCMVRREQKLFMLAPPTGSETERA